MAVERIREIRGRALALRGDNVDTDRIIPARFLRSITFEGLEHHLFEDDRAALDGRGERHPIDDPAHAGAAILLVQANFGCGSSREHAPQAIRRRGFRAVVGQSFSEIFFGNALALGLPCVSADAPVVDALMRAAEADPMATFVIDLAAETIRRSPAGESWRIAVPGAARAAWLDGSWDATGLLLENPAAIDAVARRLPYVSGWRTI